jgi:hypothetical protein
VALGGDAAPRSLLNPSLLRTASRGKVRPPDNYPTP